MMSSDGFSEAQFPASIPSCMLTLLNEDLGARELVLPKEFRLQSRSKCQQTVSTDTIPDS